MEVSAKLKRKFYRVESVKKNSFLRCLLDSNLTLTVKEVLKEGSVVLVNLQEKRLLSKSEQNQFRKLYEIQKKVASLLGSRYEEADNAIDPLLVIADYILEKNYSALQQEAKLTDGQIARLCEVLPEEKSEKIHFFEMISLEPHFLLQLLPIISNERYDIFKKDHRYKVECTKNELELLLAKLEKIPKTYVKKISKQAYDSPRH